MSELQQQETDLKALAEKATPGPWRNDWRAIDLDEERGDVSYVTSLAEGVSESSAMVVGEVYYDGLNTAITKENAAYIAACSPDAILALITRAETAEAQNKQLAKEVGDYEESEAACCPEDVGFPEYIAALTRQRDEARSLLATQAADADAVARSRPQMLSLLLAMKHDLDYQEGRPKGFAAYQAEVDAVLADLTPELRSVMPALEAMLTDAALSRAATSEPTNG